MTPHRAIALFDGTEASVAAPIEGPLLHVRFGSADELLAAWARHLAEGALFIPLHETPTAPSFRLTMNVGADVYAGQHGRRLQRPPPAGHTGVWLELTLTNDLSVLIDETIRARRAARAAMENRRTDVRVATSLAVKFENVPELAAAYASDISRGGLFVCCSPQPDLRARVEVNLALPDGSEFRVAAEVVHRVVSGPKAGVGLQFVDKDPALLAPILALIEASKPRKRRVLVVDDEAIWRSSLTRALTDLGVEVRLAADGREGLAMLIDGFFELDLVLLDLHMPNIDGRGVIERVRKQGGEQSLKLVLFSAADEDELASLRVPGFATAVFSKNESFDLLIARLCRELELPPPRAHAPTA